MVGINTLWKTQKGERQLPLVGSDEVFGIEDPEAGHGVLDLPLVPAGCFGLKCHEQLEFLDKPLWQDATDWYAANRIFGVDIVRCLLKHCCVAHDQ